jgi:hypothetical protein
MTPTQLILQAIVDLLAADPTTLAPPANANHVHLAMAPFTPSPNVVIGSFTEATFTGYTPKNVGVGAQQDFYDPVTGLKTIQLLEPAGGWHWQTTGTTNLPQTIYGYYVTDNTDAVVLGCALLDSPVLLTDAGQSVDVGYLRFNFLNTSPF